MVPEPADNASYSYAAVQLGEQADDQKFSDPICSSAGCDTKKAAGHPQDYFVPNFGMDHDIVDTQNHIKSEEKNQGHKWTPT